MARLKPTNPLNEDDELPATTGHTRKRVLTSSTDEEYVVMLPSTNCSLVNGDALQKVLIDYNVTSGQYCLISVLGWSHVRRVLDSLLLEGIIYQYSNTGTSSVSKLSEHHI